MATHSTDWPELPLDAWKDTFATLHRWTQIVGKIRLSRMPWINHSWHVPLYVSAHGLTTTPMPHGDSAFQIDFDLVRHRLLVQVCDGGSRTLALRPQSVADFHGELMAALASLDIAVDIHAAPNELEDATPFAKDRRHASYDPDHAHRLWRILVRVQRVFTAFRSRFIGKCSPVHFFWGSFDLAVTRFSGRTAPQHPGGVPHLPDWVVREAYSHEVSSCGFWPGGDPHPYPLFYSYAYPQPPGFSAARVQPDAAFYSEALGEFMLPYEAVRQAADPQAALMAFLESTYAAAADMAQWDRVALERASDPRIDRQRPVHGEP